MIGSASTHADRQAGQELVWACACHGRLSVDLSPFDLAGARLHRLTPDQLPKTGRRRTNLSESSERGRFKSGQFSSLSSRLATRQSRFARASGPRQNVDPDVSGYLPSCTFRVEAPTPGRREGHANRPSIRACGLNRAWIDAR